MAYKIDEIEGVGPALAEKFNAAGIKTVEDLLEKGASKKGRTELEEATGIDGKRILRFVNYADLFRIKGVAGEYAELLEAAGVDTVKELRNRVPQNLYNKMMEVNAEKKLVRKEPSLSQVESFVAQAKELEPKVTH